MSHRSESAGRRNARNSIQRGTPVPEQANTNGAFAGRFLSGASKVPDTYYAIRERQIALDASNEDHRHRKRMNRIEEDTAIIEQRPKMDENGLPEWSPNYNEYPYRYRGPKQERPGKERHWQDKKRWVAPVAIGLMGLGFANEFQRPGYYDERHWYEKTRWQGLVLAGICAACQDVMSTEQDDPGSELLTKVVFGASLVAGGAVMAQAVNRHDKQRHMESRSSGGRRGHGSSRDGSRSDSPNRRSGSGHRRRH